MGLLLNPSHHPSQSPPFPKPRKNNLDSLTTPPMATRRCLTTLLTRHSCSSLLSNSHSLKSLPSLQILPHNILNNPHFHPQPTLIRTLSSHSKNPPQPPKIPHQQQEQELDNDEYEDDNDDEDETSDYDSDGGEIEIDDPNVSRAYSIEDKIKEAANIGYKVIGPIGPGDRVFKPYQPVFAVVQVGSHQFKVSNGDCIYVEKLKFCEVNDKLVLNKVLMVGSSTQTIIGRPILPEAAVHAVVEEHALDAKVIIFKKRRRKNYRRTKGHRQELTRLRITDIQGIEKPETPSSSPKTVKSVSSKKAEKEAVVA